MADDLPELSEAERSKRFVPVFVRRAQIGAVMWEAWPFPLTRARQIVAGSSSPTRYRIARSARSHMAIEEAKARPRLVALEPVRAPTM